MQNNIGTNNHMVTNLGTSTSNTDAAANKYVDDKRCKFKDGTTSISTVDLRDMGLGGSLEFTRIPLYVRERQSVIYVRCK